jgi:hypothetical protein
MKLTPLGSEPDSDKNAVGLPVEVTANVPLDPAVKSTSAPLVIAGASPLLMLIDDSISGWAVSDKAEGARRPTAVHAEGPLHDTPFRLLSSVGDGSGLGTIDHTEPVHDSISVSAMLDWFGS